MLFCADLGSVYDVLTIEIKKLEESLLGIVWIGTFLFDLIEFLLRGQNRLKFGNTLNIFKTTMNKD